MVNKNNSGFEKSKQLKKETNKEFVSLEKMIKTIQEKTNKYNQLNSSFSKSLEPLQEAFTTSEINFDGLVAALNPLLKTMESLNKKFKRLDYTSVINTLNQNIQILSSSINAIEQNQLNKSFIDLKNFDCSLMQNSETSIAEMCATINDENYDEPIVDYKEFNLILKTISFINDPVKSVEFLNKALFIADNCIDYNIKILIFKKIFDEITSLIAEGFVTSAIFLISFILTILLRDTIIYKQYLEIKESVKKYKDDN